MKSKDTILLQTILNISGKIPPPIGGGWSSSNYNLNEFVKKSKSIGILFEKQNGGHFKAVTKDCRINDTLTINLHNPTTDGAKDIVRYVTKQNIIKLGYFLLNKPFEIGKKFSEHEDIIFFNDCNIEFDQLKELNKRINRKKVLEYVKLCFLLCDKFDFEYLIHNAIENADQNKEIIFLSEKEYKKYKIVRFSKIEDFNKKFGSNFIFINNFNIKDFNFVFRNNNPYGIIGLKHGKLLDCFGEPIARIDEDLINVIVEIAKEIDLIDNLTLGDFERFSDDFISNVFK